MFIIKLYLLKRAIMKNFLFVTSVLLIVSSCATTPSALSTAAAVAAKPSQDSLQSYFDLSKSSDSGGAMVSIETDGEFKMAMDKCSSQAVAQYDKDIMSEVSDDAQGDLASQATGQALVASGAGSALLAPVAVIAAPAALMYSAYNVANAASEIAARFEAEKDYALMLQQCVSESGYKISLIEFEESQP